MGDRTAEFKYEISLFSTADVLVRHNALESARVAANKFLTNKVGKKNYNFKILVYPHHVMREHSLATGAGADRFSTGMKKAYGKPVGRAARVKNGQKLMLVRTNEENVKFAKEAMRKARHKIPCRCRITSKGAA
jgi:large subunit ribosomal protein L10e